jgi:hypothetical protein
MNWSDIQELPNKNSNLSYSSIVSLNSQNSKIIINNKEHIKNDENDEKKVKIKKRHCYTCKPRGKVLKHIIEKSDIKNVIFHFDLHKRPIILVTPTNHYTNIYEISSDEIKVIFDSIKLFCEEWNIKDYQLSFNNGKWQSHSHFHIKIKTNENIINRMKKDHFKLKKLEKNYS